ncbi:MAG: DNA-directed RNA polymerase subunit beta' [Desulfosudaceae bacterium]
METIYDFFAKPVNPKSFSGIKISLASSEQILQWSYGEITKPETINYRTFRPERDGLFCAKIFGPTKDFECNCGKYKRMKHRGVTCEKCGVEVIQTQVRRERMAHIKLAAPVSHIWFLKSLPTKIGNVLDLTQKELESVLYFDRYIVVDPMDTDLSYQQILSEDAYQEALEKHGNSFRAAMGAEAIRELLQKVDLEALTTQLRADLEATAVETKRKKYSKRLKIVDALRKSRVSPSWMIMDVIPVLPPDLRPLVPLEGGRFATSDLNDLYRRVINRNNRLKRLIDLNAPEIILRNEKRMLQESVDVLFDNGRHGRAVTGSNKRPLKSLTDTLKGKQGRFRQNLLGKRVDYSGRTVITIGPNLRLHQCGLPKQMALELFKPFIYYRLEQKGYVSTVKSAKKMVEREVPEVWDTLEEVVKEYPVLLNRAPTLHRLGIQAFEPVLIEGKAIQLHPLVCTAFNADFDGDQMAVHVPLSVEAQIEARVLMLSSNNILSPANGSPIIVPTQDIVLGIYNMTAIIKGSKGEGGLFANPAEVISAYDAGMVGLHAAITVRINGQRHETSVGRVFLWETIPQEELPVFKAIYFTAKKEANAVLSEIKKGKSFEDAAADLADEDNDGGHELFLKKDKLIEKLGLAEDDADYLYSLKQGECSDVIARKSGYGLFVMTGRRSEIPYEMVNKPLGKKAVKELVDNAYRHIGVKSTVIFADRLKDIGYKYSTTGGLSISIDAMVVPEKKWEMIRQAEAKIEEISHQYRDGLITQGEKYNKSVDIWSKATDDIANEMMEAMKTHTTADDGSDVENSGKLNPVYMMADSGARGSKDQMRQLAGMRGLMAKPSGEIIETPITANFREGLSVLQYFISTHGARKGLADTALKTANSGYLTRKLADVSQDCVIELEDCGTKKGIDVEALIEGGEIIERLVDRVIGRIAGDDIYDPFTDRVLVKSGQEITEDHIEAIENSGITRIKIRSVLTCSCKRGICAKCYGRDFAHGDLIELGQAVGILAAQSIGEPGTQLTMRTFHIGGTASRKVAQAEIKARVGGTVKYGKLEVLLNANNERIVMDRRGGEFSIVSDSGKEMERCQVLYGATVTVADGQAVKAGELLAQWDPFTTPIVAEVGGTVKFGDITKGKTMQEIIDPVTGKSSKTIVESKLQDVRPRISIKESGDKTVKLPSGKGHARYPLPVDAVILVEEGEEVRAGDVIAKLPRSTTKTKDITGGLPRVAELFEVRKPKETAVLSEINGYVTIPRTATKKGKQKVVVTPVDGGEPREYLIPRGKHVNVYDGDYVKAGEEIVAGSANPQDVLNIKGAVELARYLVNEVQEVYRLQGVSINDKHIEVIVRQMMRRVKIKEIGDTEFIPDEQVDRYKFEDVNREVAAKGGRPAVGEPLILGITKASLATDSFISAASFQETTKVLTDASIAGKVDYLQGLKENLVMGRLIPAGTGFVEYAKEKSKTDKASATASS